MEYRIKKGAVADGCCAQAVKLMSMEKEHHSEENVLFQIWSKKAFGFCFFQKRLTVSMLTLNAPRVVWVSNPWPLHHLYQLRNRSTIKKRLNALYHYQKLGLSSLLSITTSHLLSYEWFIFTSAPSGDLQYLRWGVQTPRNANYRIFSCFYTSSIAKRLFVKGTFGFQMNILKAMFTAICWNGTAASCPPLFEEIKSIAFIFRHFEHFYTDTTAFGSAPCVLSQAWEIFFLIHRRGLWFIWTRAYTTARAGTVAGTLSFSLSLTTSAAFHLSWSKLISETCWNAEGRMLITLPTGERHGSCGLLLAEGMHLMLNRTRLPHALSVFYIKHEAYI